MTTPTFDIRGGNGPTRVIAIERMSSPVIACLMRRTAGLNRSTCPTISVTPARRGGRDDSLPLLHRGRDRLFDQHVDAARDAGQRDLVVKMRRRGDGHRVDAALEQRVDVVERGAAKRARDEIPLFAVRIDDAHQFDAGHIREHPRMV